MDQYGPLPIVDHIGPPVGANRSESYSGVKMKNSRNFPQMHIRLEKSIKEALRLSAEHNMRSLNDEVVFRLRVAYMQEGWLEKASNNVNKEAA